jgi:serine/threonine-protein kinase RsbW
LLDQAGRQFRKLEQRDLLLKLELQSSPELLCAVRGAMERLTEKIGFPDSECRSITRAVDEAMTNIIRHAYRNQRDQPIELACFRAKRAADGESMEGLEIILKDQGIQVDPEEMHGRPLDEVQPGGLGLHYIRQSMDIMEMTRADGTNQLRLVKYLRPGRSVGGR